jgi:uncharacterized membrane protein YfcA
VSFLIGFFTGIFSGLLGIGGGVILVPLILHFFKLMQRQAQAIGMTVMVFTGIAAAVTYALNGAIDYFAALALAAGAIIPARWGVIYSHRLADWKLRRAFGFLLVAMSLFLVVKPYITSIFVPMTGLNKGMVLLSIGIISGSLSGMMGVGGGVIMIPAMVLLMGTSQIVAQGTCLLYIVPTSAMGAYTHWRLGNIEETLLPGLMSGILFGVFAGGNLAYHFPEWILRSAFTAILVVRGVLYIRTAPLEHIVD